MIKLFAEKKNSVFILKKNIKIFWYEKPVYNIKQQNEWFCTVKNNLSWKTDTFN